MSTTFYIRYYDTQHDEQQPEGSRNQTKAAQRADLLHNNRSAANSLAQTIDAASSSTQEAQVESTVNPTPLRERQSRPESAAGEPTPLSAPQAGIFRSGPRATRFAAAALLSSLGSRSCCSQQRSSSTACRSRACFSQAASDFLLAFFRRGGEGGVCAGALGSPNKALCGTFNTEWRFAGGWHCQRLRQPSWCCWAPVPKAQAAFGSMPGGSTTGAPDWRDAAKLRKSPRRDFALRQPAALP